MNKSQCYLASALCIAFALVYSYPLAQYAPPLVEVVYDSALATLSCIFFSIGINK